MARYRKKPVVVEAFQWKDDLTGIPAWFATAHYWFADDALMIKTLEGDMRANRGDWIIRGVKGEMYPCKPDIFEQTYEPEAA
jgi:hypothetical protein